MTARDERIAAKRAAGIRVKRSRYLEPGELTAEAEQDLRFLEPNRSRDRLVGILNEFGRRIAALEAMHHD